MAWCLLPPSTVRWDGEVQLGRIPWAILQILLAISPDGRAVAIGEVETAVGREWADTTLRPIICRLNQALERIGWPWDYGVRAGYIRCVTDLAIFVAEAATVAAMLLVGFLSRNREEPFPCSSASTPTGDS